MNFLSSLFSGLMGGMGGGMSSGGMAQQNPIMSLFGNLLNGGGQGGDMLRGAGVMGLGHAMTPKVKAPDFNTPQMQAYQNFTQSPPSLPESMQGEINKSLAISEEDQLKELRNIYKNLRPGTDYTTDSTYQRDLANLQRNQASNRTNAMMGPTLSYLQPQRQALSENAQMSLYQPMMKSGMESEKRSGLMDMFSNIGSSYLKKGMGFGGFNG